MMPHRIKEGHLGVRGHFLWRERHVVLMPGELSIYRILGGALKSKINFHDDALKVTFHADQRDFTLSVRGKDTVLQCKSEKERDEWISAVDMSRRSTLANEGNTFIDAEEEHAETLRIFQDVRVAMSEGLSFHHVNHRMQPLDSSRSLSYEYVDDYFAKQLASITNFIHSNDRGGVIILLHLQVLDSMGIQLKNILRVLAKHHSRTQLSQHKSRISDFIRSLLFHKHYSSLLEADDEANDIISTSFPFCRLRHYDTDIKLRSGSLGSHPNAKLHLKTELADEMKGNTFVDSPRANGEISASEDSLRRLLWEYPIDEFARQLTISSHDDLSEISPFEFLKIQQSGFMEELGLKFTRLTLYLVWSVIVEESPRERAEVIEQITTLAMEALDLQNYHLLMACLGCLGDIPLMPTRLPLSWKKVRTKAKSQLKQLRKLCVDSGGYDKLRKCQEEAASNGPSVPYVGLVNGRLERLRGMPNIDPHGNLNFEKFELQYDAVFVLEQTTVFKYEIEPENTLYRFCNEIHHDFLTPGLLHKRSLHLMAIETSQIHTSVLSGSSCLSWEMPVFSFRAICHIVNQVTDFPTRLEVYLQALFSDHRINETLHIRNFWLDIKQNSMCASPNVLMSGIRYCINKVYTQIRDERKWELIQLTGISELTTDMLNQLYISIARYILIPISAWTWAILRKELTTEDSNIVKYWKHSPSDRVVDLLFHQLQVECSPIRMVELLTNIKTAVEQQVSNGLIQHFTTCLTQSSFKYPHSALHYIKSTLETSSLSAMHIESIKLYEEALNSILKSDI